MNDGLGDEVHMALAAASADGASPGERVEAWAAITVGRLRGGRAAWR